MNVLITGGAGFIGSNFVEYFVKKYPQYKIIVLDKLTYAGSLENLKNVIDKITFIKGDICDEEVVQNILKKYNINGIVNFAAESHVDNSIKEPLLFTNTNIIGTHVLIETARKVWGEKSSNKFVQISTDEIYGSIDKGYYRENSPIKPSSPYSASKASSDMIVLAYSKTYGMNVSVVNCSNNYGPHQHREKLIPHTIKLALENQKIPLYGTGLNIRNWLYVEDNCEAIDLAFHKGREGERYNIGGQNEKQNTEIVKFILEKLKKPEKLITYVEDRKGHDYRYAMDCSKIKEELGWQPKTKFEDGMLKTIEWYIKEKSEDKNGTNNINSMFK